MRCVPVRRAPEKERLAFEKELLAFGVKLRFRPFIVNIIADTDTSRDRFFVHCTHFFYFSFFLFYLYICVSPLVKINKFVSHIEP